MKKVIVKYIFILNFFLFQSEDMASKLELELELQKQITSAAHKLASDKSVSRFVRKQRRHSFIKAQNKVGSIQNIIYLEERGLYFDMEYLKNDRISLGSLKLLKA